MRFLNPSLLWFLPLGALPILIHLLFSVKPVKIDFSSVFLLWSVRRARRRPTRLLQALILLLRCLAVLALISAFSKPVIESGPLSRLPGLAAGTGRPLSLVVLADRSYSMSAAFSGQTRYAFAAGNAGRILGSLGKKDEAALVFFDETAEPGADWTAEPGTISKALSAARPGYKATDYAKGLEKAYGLLAPRPAGRRKAVLLLTDSAQNGFAGFPRNITAIPAYDPQAALMGFSFAQSPNSWLREVTGRAGRAGTVELSAFLGGESGAAGGGEAGLFSSPPAGAMGKTITGRFRNGAAAFDLGTLGPDPAGRVELTGPDALSSDNAAYFAFQWAAPRTPRVLTLYSGEQALRPGGGAYFIKKFLETESGRGRFSALRADFAQYSEERIRLEDYGAVILAGPPAGARWAKAVKDYLHGGGGVFLVAVPGGNESPGREQGALWEALGLRSEGLINRKFSLAQTRDSAFFDGEDFSGFDLPKAAAGRIVSLEGTTGFETPWNFKDEAGALYPALLYKQQGKGKLLVWTSAFDLGFADLPAKPVFAPFMALNVKKLFGLAEPAAGSVPVDGTYEGRLKSADSARVSVTAPDGAKSYLFSEGGTFKYGLTSRPGLYRWSAPPEAGAFAVNLDHGKGESALLAAKRPPWHVLRPEEPVADFKSALYGVEIGQFLLFLALAFSLAEFLLSRKVL
ncbi:MAG: BatA and WFA domain-containing protein [Elusimicrobiota bacterium]|nr:BatA and WFA domain-containing protein [Elusimicrobiota bacterium]